MQLRRAALLVSLLPVAFLSCGGDAPSVSRVDPLRSCSGTSICGARTECVLTFAMVRVPAACVETVESVTDDDLLDATPLLDRCLPPCEARGPLRCVDGDVEVCAPFGRKLRLSCADLCAFRGLRYAGTCASACACERAR